jgi:hypothetical protein
MGDLRRRLADPPFPAAVRLLGRTVPLVAARSLPHAERRAMLGAVHAAVARLEGQAATGQLSAADRRYLGALSRFVLGRGRSGQDRGAFTFGLADVRASRDAGYWASALVHDGVHAWRQRRGRAWRDETAPCEAQIDYLQRTGGDPALIAHVARFRDSAIGRRRRLAEPV